jgi:hypothetical protein
VRKNNGTAILLFTYSVIVILIIIAATFVLRTISEKNISTRYKELIEAFNLAEAGVSRAISEVRQDYNWAGPLSVSLGMGQYSVLAVDLDGKRKILSCGYIPSIENFRAKRTIEAVVKKYIPSNFYDNAIYVGDELDLNGNAYRVNGNVIYGDEHPADNTGNINGTVTQDTSINPLARIDFEQLYNLSQGQGNVYDAQRLDAVKSGRDSFPSSFWYSQPADPNDPATGVPNIVYILTDLELKGNIGTVGGFFVVVGDVLTNPLGTYDTQISGNGQIDGCVYTLGTFEINGGGNGLNVLGGIWADREVELNGNATVVYNEDYMKAIKALNINPDVQLLSWREL